jgi:signal transduction histidine kinase
MRASQSHKRPWAQRMFARVLRYGILLLLAAAVALATLVGLAMRTIENDSRALTAWLSIRACAVQTAAELKDFPIPTTVYESDGVLVATSVEPALKLEPEPHTLFPVRNRMDVVYCDDEHRELAARRRYAILQNPRLSVGFMFMGLAFIGVLVVVVVASVPLARSITAPIEDIAKTTKSFGDGDLTARTHIQSKDELGDLARAFNQMADRITILLRQEKELLANVSHELRTPLARMRVVLEDAQEAPGRTGTALLEIERDLSDLERLVDDVLDAVRLEAKSGYRASSEFSLRRETVSVHLLFQTSRERFGRSYPQREVISEAHLDLRVDGDSALLLRVIDNLLENARRYSEEPSVIHLRARRSEANVVIEVEDHGIGIEPSDIPRVFTPFFRGDRSRSRATGGVGLGLSICQKIVAAHGGTLSLVSKVNAGTTVLIRLPELPSS